MKAVQTEEGVSLLWETVNTDIQISNEVQSFLLVKNGQVEEVTTSVEDINEKIETSGTGQEVKKESFIQENLDESEENLLILEAMSISENPFSVMWYGSVDRTQGRIAKYELYLDETLVSSGGPRFADYKFTNLNADTTYVVTVKAFSSSNVPLLESSLEVSTIPNPTG
ncbi:fibronectin type III domain-containing protein [Sutcliffiella halmapala]|uniref:fibronectin type III domain-containing protein n=1 Tax=Sutcliffiella halmapala TaxID=79882 RepID=UPI001117225D|nr:hypothetical protein [Sutcliffiella halmapala]